MSARLDLSAAPATLAGDTDAAGAVAGVFVRYTANGVRAILELKGDPFEICNAVRARIFLGESLPKRDARFEAMMKARKALEKKS